MGDSVIEVQGLVKRYGPLAAVDGIDLEVRSGEVFAFLGPNGAGKTTTVEVLEGIRPRSAGSVRVLGHDPWKDRAKLQRRVGVIPQDFTFFDKITPVESIQFYGRLFDKRPDPTRLLREVELEEKADDAFEKLSGGQKQKLGLALALVNDPEVLFLDEPTTGLDPQARRAIWDVMRALRRGGRTIFLTTHYLEEAETLADRVGIIDHGKIVALGTPEEIITRFGRRPRLRIEGSPAIAERLRGEWSGEVQVEDGRTLVEIRTKEDVLAVLQLVERSGLPWSEVATQKDTLEDVFIRLVGRMSEGTVGTKDRRAGPPVARVKGVP